MNIIVGMIDATMDKNNGAREERREGGLDSEGRTVLVHCAPDYYMLHKGEGKRRGGILE